MNPDKLKAILGAHDDWLRDCGGKRADLRGADLRDADLRDADLRRAYLRGAYLLGADLRRADLRDADLRRAYLLGADLRDANLRRADLRDADLRGADLRGADLPFFQICHGALNVWKAGYKHIINLEIPAEAKRTAALTGRKCRAEYAKVLAIYDADGNPVDSCPGWHDQSFIYRVGEIVRPDSYDDDIRVECTNGIHFFLTREEAEAWA